MLAVRVEKEIEDELNIFAKELNKTKTEIIKEAIKKYLKEIEDNRIKEQKEAINYLLKNPINTNMKNLKVIQKVKNEKNLS